MSDKVYNVLFICTHNSARSIMAEGLLTSMGGGRFKAYSAGSQPGGTVNPFALKTLKAFHIPSDGYRSKDWNEFAQPGAPELDFVFTVCDNAAGEVCPVWPGQPITAHWGIPDPAAVDGTDEQRRRAFADASQALLTRMRLFTALPVDKLDALALRQQVREIGRAPS